MSKAQKLNQLRQLTAMVLDHELVAVQRAARLRDHTLANIEALRPVPITMDEDAGPAGAIAALRYQNWADARRSELQRILAGQTAIWLDAQDQARLAFGKSQAMDQLADHLAVRRAAERAKRQGT